MTPWCPVPGRPLGDALFPTSQAAGALEDRVPVGSSSSGLPLQPSTTPSGSRRVCSCDRQTWSQFAQFPWTETKAPVGSLTRPLLLRWANQSQLGTGPCQQAAEGQRQGYPASFGEARRDSSPRRAQIFPTGAGAKSPSALTPNSFQSGPSDAPAGRAPPPPWAQEPSPSSFQRPGRKWGRGGPAQVLSTPPPHWPPSSGPCPPRAAGDGAQPVEGRERAGGGLAGAAGAGAGPNSLLPPPPRSHGDRRRRPGGS